MDPRCPKGYRQEGDTCYRIKDAGSDAEMVGEPDADADVDTGAAIDLGAMMDADMGAQFDAAAGTDATRHDDSSAIADAAVDADGPAEQEAGTACAFECKLGRGRRIAAGWRDTCVINNAGSVYCWGNNDEGEVGDGTRIQAPSPMRVALPERAVEVSIKGYFTCAVLEDGTLYCWGVNTDAQLGTGSASERELTPQRAQLNNVAEVAAGGNFTCARQEGAAFGLCWGNGKVLGRGASQGGSTSPVTPNGASSINGHKAIGTSGVNVCVQHSAGQIAGRVSCWGWNENGQTGVDPLAAMWVYTPTLVSGLSGVTHLAVGARHSCAVTLGTSIACWGWNSQGQLGNGGGSDSHAPVVVGGNELQGAIVDLASGASHSCAVLEGNKVVCWGGNSQGQLGLGDKTSRSTPVRVSGISAAAAQAAAGDYHTCIYLETDDVACWGYGAAGALGTGGTADELTPRVVEIPDD